MPSTYSTYPPSMSKDKSKIEDLAEMIADALLDHLQEQATISVDCKIHGRFKHIPIPMIKPGRCPDCYFNDEILKEMSMAEDWIDPSKLH